MKLTESKLKQLILEAMSEELIQEVAKGPQDLPEDIYVKVFKWNRRIVVMFTDADGRQIPPSDRSGKDNPIWGDVSFYEKDPKGRPCDGASIIAVTEVADGWGPMLYDIAMEVATMRTNGLASDRQTVSPEAQDVWEYYRLFRSGLDDRDKSDVKMYQLDNEYNDLTPQEDDNCGQRQSRERAQDYGEDWTDNALSKRFTKEPATLNQIRDKLIWEL